MTKEFIKLVVEERVTGHQWMKENLFVIGSEHDKKQEDSECDPSDMVSHTDVHYS